MIISLIFLLILFLIEFFNPISWLAGTSLYIVVIITYWTTTIWYLLKYKKGQLFCFETLFAISFFLASFIGSIILPLLDSWHARIFIKGEVIQNKIYYICIIGYLCYLLGLCTYNKSKTSTNDRENIKSFIGRIHRSRIKLTNWITFAIIVLFYIKGGSALLTLYSNQVDDLNSRLGSWGEYLIYSMTSYTVSVFVTFLSKDIDRTSLCKFCKSLPLIFYVNSILLVVPLIVSGYRSNAVQIIIPTILMYSLAVRRIKSSNIIFLLLAGYAGLFVIGIVRSGGSLDMNNVDIIALFQDFQAANGATSYFIDYVDNHGTSGGSNMILKVISVIPFMQSTVINLFGENSFAVESSVVYTNTFMDSADGGLGTSLIGDLYYSLGLVGTMVLMYFLGLVISYVNKAKNLYAILVLLILTGNAIFAARVEYFYIIRWCAFAMIQLFIILHLGKSSNVQYVNPIRL